MAVNDFLVEGLGVQKKGQVLRPGV